jgi:hypothetical protein
MGHYDTIIEQEYNLENNNKKQSSVSTLPQRGSRNVVVDPEINKSPVFKHSEGKAAGARFYYLEELGNITGNGDLKNLGKCLFMYAAKPDIDLLGAAYRACVVYINDHNLTMEAVKARMDALKNEKYTLQSYKNRLNLELLQDAAARHFIKLCHGENCDDESGAHHIGHIMCNILMMYYQQQHYY